MTTAPDRIGTWTVEDLAALPRETLELLAEGIARRRVAAQKRTVARKLTAYQKDPVGYIRDVLGFELTGEQQRICELILHNRRVLIKASHAVGKSFLAACLACWWFDCWDQHIVYITAPTWDQALGLTFKKVERFRSEKNLPGRILRTGRVLDENRTKATAHYIRALNAERSEGFQGEHDADMLIIVEEGVGVPQYIWDAVEGLLTSRRCRVLTIGNPTNESTTFGVNAEKASWTSMSISCLFHPNVVAELYGMALPFPGAVELLWLVEQLEKECERVRVFSEDNFWYWALPTLKAAAGNEEGENKRPLPLGWTLPRAIEAKLKGEPLPEGVDVWLYQPNAFFQGRVLGEFPSMADEQVIPKAWLRNLPVIEGQTMPEIGSDQARKGRDRTTILAQQDGHFFMAEEIRQQDQYIVTNRLRFAALTVGVMKGVNPKAVPLKLDITGGLGTGPCDTLTHEGYNVIGVNASQTADDPDMYENRRSELYFTTRDRARTKTMDLSGLAPDMREKIIREWGVPTWSVTKKGKKRVEDKEDIKKRIDDSSPDLAEGGNLALHSGAWRAGQMFVPTADQLQPDDGRKREIAEMLAMAKKKLPSDVAEHLTSLYPGMR